MPEVSFTEEEQQDHYPAVLDVIGKAFAVAEIAPDIGTAEKEVLDAMQVACLAVLREKDPASLPLVTVGGP